MDKVRKGRVLEPGVEEREWRKLGGSVGEKTLLGGGQKKSSAANEKENAANPDF